MRRDAHTFPFDSLNLPTCKNRMHAMEAGFGLGSRDLAWSSGVMDFRFHFLVRFDLMAF